MGRDVIVKMFWGIRVPRKLLEELAVKIYKETNDDFDFVEDDVRDFKIIDERDIGKKFGLEFELSGREFYIPVSPPIIVYDLRDSKYMKHSTDGTAYTNSELDKVDEEKLNKARLFLKDYTLEPKPVCTVEDSW